MDRQGGYFGHTATRTRIAQQRVDQLGRGLRMQSRPVRLASIYARGELPTNAWDDYQLTIGSMGIEVQGRSCQ